MTSDLARTIGRTAAGRLASLFAFILILTGTAWADSVAVSVGSQSGTLTYGTAGSVTFSVTSTKTETGSNPNITSGTLVTTGSLPSGATATFAANPAWAANSGGAVGTTLTITTT